MADNKPAVKIKDTSKETTKERFSAYSFEEVELPRVIEKAYEGFVTYGERNEFPQRLILAWLQSSTHNAITNGIIQMIAGDDLTFSETNLEVEAFAKKINSKGETLEDLINKTAFDLYLHGYFGWQIVWNHARTKIVSIYHTPAEQIRAGKSDDEGVINDYYVSWDWENYRKEKFKPTKIKAYDPADRSEGKQMMFVKQYRPSQYYYSTPSYIGGMNWILLDNRVGEFHLNNIEHGFFPSSIIQFFNGEPPQEEKRKIEMNFMAKFTGKNTSKMVFVYNNNLEEKVSFDTHEPANIDKRFKELMPEISKNIMIAHRVPSPLLFGVRDAGGLGNNAEELESSSLLMNKMVIIPFQKIILGALAEVFKVNQWPVEVTIETLQPSQWLEGQSDDADATTEEKVEEKQAFNDLRQIMPEKLVKPLLLHLDNVGTKLEDLEAEGYTLVMDDGAMTEEGLKRKLRKEQFSVDTSNVDPGDSVMDGFYLVRYQYRAGQGYQPIIKTTREFCSHMISVNGEKVYSVEEIHTLDNPEFGDYNIFAYKGSYNCRHRWARMVWFKTVSSRGSIKGYKAAPADAVPGQFLPPGDDEATKVNDRVKK